VSQQYAVLLGSPFQYSRITCTREPGILHTQDVQTGPAPKQTANNVVVEVLVSSQTQHLLLSQAWSAGPTSVPGSLGDRSGGPPPCPHCGQTITAEDLGEPQRRRGTETQRHRDGDLTGFRKRGSSVDALAAVALGFASMAPSEEGKLGIVEHIREQAQRWIAADDPRTPETDRGGCVLRRTPAFTLVLPSA